jgi:hypothetical protein
MKSDPSKFYGPSSTLPIGAGVLLRDCPFPVPSAESRKFLTCSGLALVLTHECDIAPDNDRSFNEHAIVIPVVPLSIWVDDMIEQHGVGSWGGILAKIASNEVFRIMYLPPTPAAAQVPELAFGGIVNLNTMTSTPLEWHEHYKTISVCSLTAIGLRNLDYKITNHLLREKSVNLWGMR